VRTKKTPRKKKKQCTWKLPSISSLLGSIWNGLLSRLNRHQSELNLRLRALYQCVRIFILYPRSDRFFVSVEWQLLRLKTLRKYGAQCMKCLSVKGRMHVDHIKPRSRYPKLALSARNLQVLCEKCNLEKGNKNEIDYRPRRKRD
jgi:5-methylcytosine-specific restriction endonuclease McrA